MAVIDLSQLPAPQIIEVPDFEALLAERKAAFVALYPADEQDAVRRTLELESEPITKLLQENTYREILLLQRVNEAAQAVMVAYARGSDLDQLAAHTRSSFQVSSETKECYNQCTNIECGHTFVTHETFVRSVCRPQKISAAHLTQKVCRNNLHTNPLRRFFYSCRRHNQNAVAILPPLPKKKGLRLHVTPCFIWWSWRELNPRPKFLHPRYYMLSLVFTFAWQLRTDTPLPD